MLQAILRLLGITQHQAQIAQLQAQVTALQHQMLLLRTGLSREYLAEEFERMPVAVAIVAAPAADSGWPSTLNTRQFPDLPH